MSLDESYVRFALIENEHRTRQATRAIKHFLKTASKETSVARVP